MTLELQSYIRDVPDFPKTGITFKDISPLLANPAAMKLAIEMVKAKWVGRIDAIAGLDARGFIFGGILAFEMDLPFVMLRKKGKLPGKTIGISYSLEYGSSALEIQENAFPTGARVLILDDLLATGGTAAAACKLIETTGGTVAGCAFVVELLGLRGRNALEGREVQSLIAYRVDEK